jgi:hypothetical protein
MAKGFRLILLAAVYLVVAVSSPADDAPKPDLKPLLAEVCKLVEKHYPKAEVALKDGDIHFQFNTRKFMIHEPLLTGEWQDAHEEVGPQKGASSRLASSPAVRRPGCRAAVVRQAVLRRAADGPYPRNDHHLYVRLKYPRDVPRTSSGLRAAGGRVRQNRRRSASRGVRDAAR